MESSREQLENALRQMASTTEALKQEMARLQDELVEKDAKITRMNSELQKIKTEGGLYEGYHAKDWYDAWNKMRTALRISKTEQDKDGELRIRKVSTFRRRR